MATIELAPQTKPSRTSANAPAPFGQLAQQSHPNSITKGVIANWLCYVVVLVSGFLIPRWIGDSHGKEILGIWDLGWSLIFYVGLLKFGATATVNRYVSRYRTLQDWNSLNASFNCCLTLLICSAFVGILSALTVAYFASSFLPGISATSLVTAQWLIIVLGVAASIEMPFAAFNSVITGYERFDLLNIIRGGKELSVLAAMIGFLAAGSNMVVISLIVLTAEIGCGIAEICAAKRLCPHLSLSPRHCNRKMTRKVFAFGGKSLTRSAARAALYQVNGILVSAFLGPAALAVYSRQRALVTHVMKLVKQFAQVYIPVCSALDAKGDAKSLRVLLIQSAKAGWCITLPMMIVLILFGGPIVHLWMGDGYEAPLALAILALGHLPSVAQLGPYSVLEGLGRHGFAAVIELVAATLGIVATAMGLAWFEWSILGAASAIALCIALSTGLLVPWYACRIVGVSARQYCKESMPHALLANLPLIICMLTARWIFADSPPYALTIGLSIGGLFTAWTYWRWVLPMPWKSKLTARLYSRAKSIL
ncbi:MAG: lipopolysaccharide biosynthesis protein [Planctomycetota bacterium]